MRQARGQQQTAEKVQLEKEVHLVQAPAALLKATEAVPAQQQKLRVPVERVMEPMEQ